MRLEVALWHCRGKVMDVPPSSSGARRLRTAFVASFFATIIACGKSPIAPALLPIHTGRSLLQIQGFDLSTDPNYTPCQPLRVAAGGNSVCAHLDAHCGCRVSGC